MRSYPSPGLSSSEPPKRKQPLLNRFFGAIHTLSASDGFLMRLALVVCGVFLLAFLIQASMHYTVTIATGGGTFSEGIVGVPRFVNPVLAVTRADKDLSALADTHPVLTPAEFVDRFVPRAGARAAPSPEFAHWLETAPGSGRANSRRTQSRNQACAASFDALSCHSMRTL